MEIIRINDCIIGEGSPAFVIAEVGQSHDGSLGLAHSYIDAIADTGADAVKFQTHCASDESTLDDVFRVKFSRQDASRFDYWKRMEFSREQWKDLASHANERGLIFLSSAFSVTMLDMLLDIGVSTIKVASGEVTHEPFMEKIKEAGLPVLLSTGMSSWNEIIHCVTSLQADNVPVVPMQCTSQYPTPLEKVGLNILDELRHRFSLLVGLSDHSGSIYPSLAAIARGINVLEVHVTLSREMFGPDTSSSLTLDELKMIIDYRSAVLTMDNSPINKDCVAEELSEMRQLFSRSIALVKTLEKGATLTEADITLKKPGSGIPASQIDRVIGQSLLRRVESNRLLKWEDVSENQ